MKSAPFILACIALLFAIASLFPRFGILMPIAVILLSVAMILGAR